MFDTGWENTQTLEERRWEFIKEKRDKKARASFAKNRRKRKRKNK